MLSDVIVKWGGVEVLPMELYRDMFWLGDGLLQTSEDEPGLFKTNPVGYYKYEKHPRGNFRVLFEDTFEEVLAEMQEADFSILNGITYFGRRNLMANANKMYAMIFDLDGITESTLANFFSGAMNADVYPVPNYINLSGHGVHLYYLFEEPLPLYPNIKMQLKELKYALIRKMWNMYTSTIDKPQYQGINQGFRPAGAKTKIPGVVVRSFRIHQHPFSLQELCRYVPEEHRVDETKLWKETTMTLEQAKRKFPEWYEKRVVNGEPKGTWTCKRDLYDWWLRKIQTSASPGHRYFCIMCLAIYAVKSGISFEELERDAYGLIEHLNELKSEDPFTEADVESALECYDEKYITFPLKDISKISGIEIQKNKRNGRKRDVHIKYMNNQRGFKVELGECTNGGRPSAEQVIRAWQQAHPDASKADCIRETGLSKPTVYKWWDGVLEQQVPAPIPVIQEQVPEQEPALDPRLIEMLLKMTDEQRKAFMEFAERTQGTPPEFRRREMSKEEIEEYERLVANSEQIKLDL